MQFENPLAVSKGIKKDRMYVQFVNPDIFLS